MGQNQAILIGLLVAPVILLLLLRVNATMVFLSLCLGYVVMQFTAPDVKTFADLFMPHATMSTNVMKLVLLLFPSVFTSLFMIRTVRGLLRRILNIFPSIGVGCLVLLFVVPLLPPSMSIAISSSLWWHEAVRLQDIVVGAAALVSLFFLWAQHPQKHQEEKSRRS